ncbi:conserved hypothetical protein [Neospora caninum Liverpool]|uniref:TLC domain-containing protein n=1 Tax=Neospora caninum (strain Liverpool) TaxID=572307 RepID=F0V9G0_NEOCL|nr:conserved hypothetical protein [Neospora caninum Liverpool]CBZ50385.1 conserved hypothetical protein [Neospora caninum Liverpool]CEL64993.1 TPA: hypothetical protein BN1204_008540 [Neospora caninum Liverpool]|eukprot:XP_003880419.1 conserved hypothetical protein [Neospora caninum Liverpool]
MLGPFQAFRRSEWRTPTVLCSRRGLPRCVSSPYSQSLFSCVALLSFVFAIRVESRLERDGPGVRDSLPSAPSQPETCYPPSFSLFWIVVSAGLWFVVASLPVHRIPLLFVPAQVRERVLQQVRDARRTLMDATDGEAEREKKTAAKDFLVSVRNRSVGFVHASIISVLSLACVTLDKQLIDDKIFGCSPLFTVTGIILTGYFLWDFCVILWHWTPAAPQWLLHCAVSVITAANPFLVLPGEPPMCFYAASLILFELSTPFLALRYFMLRAYVFHPSPADGKSEGDAKLTQNGEKGGARTLPRCYTLVSVCFFLAFFLVRILWGLGWMLPSLLVFLSNGDGALFRPWRRYIFYASVPLFSALNLYWLYMIVESVLCKRQKKKQQ